MVIIQRVTNLLIKNISSLIAFVSFAGAILFVFLR